MECGWDTNTIAPIEQGQDWSVADEGISSVEECHQACLERDACRAYRWDGKSGIPCEIFNVGIGPNGANLLNPTPSGSQWWDRACQSHLPAGCKETSATAPPSKRVVHAAKPAPAQPIITAAPVVAPEAVARAPALAKRDASFPEYMSDLTYFWSSLYVTPACSCIISSAQPPVPSNTTTTFTKYTATVSTTETTVDPFTVTVTPRETTVYSCRRRIKSTVAYVSITDRLKHPQTLLEAEGSDMLAPTSNFAHPFRGCGRIEYAYPGYHPQHEDHAATNQTERPELRMGNVSNGLIQLDVDENGDVQWQFLSQEWGSEAPPVQNEAPEAAPSTSPAAPVYPEVDGVLEVEGCFYVPLGPAYEYLDTQESNLLPLFHFKNFDTGLLGKQRTRKAWEAMGPVLALVSHWLTAPEARKDFWFRIFLGLPEEHPTKPGEDKTNLRSDPHTNMRLQFEIAQIICHEVTHMIFQSRGLRIPEPYGFVGDEKAELGISWGNYLAGAMLALKRGGCYIGRLEATSWRWAGGSPCMSTPVPMEWVEKWFRKDMWTHGKEEYRKAKLWGNIHGLVKHDPKNPVLVITNRYFPAAKVFREVLYVGRTVDTPSSAQGVVDGPGAGENCDDWFAELFKRETEQSKTDGFPEDKIREASKWYTSGKPLQP
ncbi:hypothetical protein BU23DRAFT_652387 [Bimuria novae-zelandiae CBS 107.79]|uniref:Apple domain-containing protein n=1 Tax=Bimuria novae-zelandiae CBS 107.79 TaxID=1447943 RepID=A0A6A5V8M1_9PLEO|nr:hypothetical protein BU23DRAFT_652387 [Bimuria novae-zelandiae CBS 107.79]